MKKKAKEWTTAIVNNLNESDLVLNDVSSFEVECNLEATEVDKINKVSVNGVEFIRKDKVKKSIEKASIHHATKKQLLERLGL